MLTNQGLFFDWYFLWKLKFMESFGKDLENFCEN